MRLVMHCVRCNIYKIVDPLPTNQSGTRYACKCYFSALQVYPNGKYLEVGKAKARMIKDETRLPDAPKKLKIRLQEKTGTLSAPTRSAAEDKALARRIKELG